MNFAQQTALLKATAYFNKEMEKVYVRRNCQILHFEEIAHNPKGGRCYYLSTWALMGLKSEDGLLRGQIDLPERTEWKAEKNYKHGWVEFFYEDNMYIYDSLENVIWEYNHWYEIHHPHNITFNMTQQEILTLAIQDSAFDNAHQISDYIYQFKKSQDMDLQYNSEHDGFLKDTLAGSQIRYGYNRVSYFLAESRN